MKTVNARSMAIHPLGRWPCCIRIAAAALAATISSFAQADAPSHWAFVPPSRDAVDANLPIRERRGARPGERYGEMLDRLGVDLFLGIHPPQVAPTSRPWFHTTTHLEGEAGWVRVFRNLDSSVYLRGVPRNQANLDRIASYYDERGIPFDRARGFDPAAM